MGGSCVRIALVEIFRQRMTTQGINGTGDRQRQPMPSARVVACARCTRPASAAFLGVHSHLGVGPSEPYVYFTAEQPLLTAIWGVGVRPN